VFKNNVESLVIKQLRFSANEDVEWVEVYENTFKADAEVPFPSSPNLFSFKGKGLANNPEDENAASTSFQVGNLALDDNGYIVFGSNKPPQSSSNGNGLEELRIALDLDKNFDIMGFIKATKELPDP